MATDDPECPFCAIIANGGGAREVHRDDQTVAFFPTNPATLGHTLVIPRQHIPTIWDVNPAVAAAVGATTLAVAHALRATVGPDGLNIVQSNGAAATQTVPHLHVHVVPRWDDDQIGDFWPDTTNFSDDELERTRSRVQNAVNRYLATK